jgi:protein-tyrosine phosphatase
MPHINGNDPLRIAELSLGRGYIGLTLCPGKQDAEARSGPCRRSLDVDLSVIKQWGAVVVVTLLEDHELEKLRVGDLAEAVPARGMSWWRFPLPDRFALEYEGNLKEDWWTLPCALLVRLLHAGGKVLIHCRGGLGRTGSLAARLLMEEGMAAAEAVRRVRQVRPGAIETASQEHYLEHRLPALYESRRKKMETFAALPEESIGYPVRALLEHPETFVLTDWLLQVKALDVMRDFL